MVKIARKPQATQVRLMIGIMFLSLLLASCATPQKVSVGEPLTSTVTATHTPTIETKPTVTPWPDNPPTIQAAILPSPTQLPPLSLSDLAGLGRIAFFDSRGWVSVINADGTNRTELNQPAGNASSGEHQTCELAWSPTGKRIVFGGDRFVYILPSNGGEAFQLTEDSMDCVDWSADGEFIAFVAGGERMEGGQAFYTEVFTIRPSGADKTRLTFNNQSVIHVDFSPKTPSLVFDGDRKDIYTLEYGPGISLNKLQLPSHAEDRFMNPVWSPDGNLLAFEGYRQYVTSPDLYISNADGSQKRQLTSNSSSFAPAWSPDGKWLAYKFQFGQANEFYLMILDIRSGEQKTLATLDTYDKFSRPAWSPDGKYIAYESAGDIQIVEVETGRTTMLTRGSGPVWSPTTRTYKPYEDCTSGWSKLQIWQQGKVMGGPSDLPNRIRANPGKSAEQIGQLYPGAVFEVLEGPICADGLVFWLVESDQIPGGSGWTAEGDGKEYWLEPYQP